MKKILPILFALLTACATATPLPTVAPTLPPSPTSAPTPTSVPVETVEVATPSPTSTLEAQAFRFSSADGMPQVYIPAGVLHMGGYDVRAAPDEFPAHEVTLDAFWMDQLEVTTAMYALCVSRGACDLPQNPGTARIANYFGKPEFNDYPVIYVTWGQAKTYCEWANRRLPTEAEWERAARYGKAPNTMLEPPRNADGTYAANTFQGDFPNRDSGQDGHAGTAPVGCYGADSLGAYDLLGNVWEWTRDDYRITGQPTDEPSRILKGGSYLCSEHFCARYRPAARQPGTENLGTSHIGFRTVLRVKSQRPRS